MVADLIDSYPEAGQQQRAGLNEIESRGPIGSEKFFRTPPRPGPDSLRMSSPRKYEKKK